MAATFLPTERLSLKFRLLGILPFSFFLAQGAHYFLIHQLGHMFWMCNIGNLLLAIGLFLDRPVLIRVAGIWSITGLFVWGRFILPQWFHYATLDWGAVVSGTLAHVGGVIVGFLSLHRVRVDKSAWVYSFVWYLLLQVISRLATAPDLNVNVSQKIYEGWEQSFTAYWKFWLAMTVAVGACLWLLIWVLNKLWPPLTITQRE
jgi:hypothetical protein